MPNNNFWKYGLAIGAGVAVGAVGAILLSRNSVDIKKACTTLLSHGFDLKEKAASYMETAKENVEDITAEARHEYEKRKTGASS